MQAQRRFWRAHMTLLFVGVLMVCAACAATPQATQPAGVEATTSVPTAPPTVTPRAANASEIILATTTSTQDSGLLDVLVPLFEQQSGLRVKVIAVGSGAAIGLGTRGEADVVLAHAPDSEKEFVASGAGTDRQLVMFNDFVLVGPPDDPAKVQGTADVVQAFGAIAAQGQMFVSRGDNSGTHQLELKLWGADVTPQGQAWYVESGTGMGQTLQIADQKSAYTLSDRATFLAFAPRLALEVLVEGDLRLRNVYHVIAVNSERFPLVNHEGAQAFIAFLLSPETQALIGTFGQDRYGQPLFTPCAQNSCQLPEADV